MNEARVERNALRALLLIIPLGISLKAHADDPPPLGWSGKGEAGVALSSSNAGTRSNTANAKMDVAYDLPLWKHALGASGVYASSENPGDAEKIVTDNRWEAHEQSDYKFSEKGFWFGGLHYDEDHVGSYAYQASAATGLGYKLYNTDRTKFSVQFGVGYKVFKQRVEPPEISSRDHDLIGTGLLDYQRTLTNTTLLTEKMALESGSSNTMAQNDLGVQVKVSTLFAIALAYQVRYNSNPAAGFGHYDRLTTVNLVYKFKHTGGGAATP